MENPDTIVFPVLTADAPKLEGRLKAVFLSWVTEYAVWCLTHNKILVFIWTPRGKGMNLAQVTCLNLGLQFPHLSNEEGWTIWAWSVSLSTQKCTNNTTFCHLENYDHRPWHSLAVLIQKPDSFSWCYCYLYFVLQNQVLDALGISVHIVWLCPYSLVELCNGNT